MSMAGNQRLSILSNVTASDVRLDPYPHLIINNALDPDVFSALDAQFPSDDVVVNARPLHDTWYDYPACNVVRNERFPSLWRDFFAYHVSGEFFRELVALVGDHIRQMTPQLEERAGRRLEEFHVGMRPGGKGDPLAPGADVSMECQFYVNYSRMPRAVRGPHVDRPSELFAALLYFRQPQDDSSGGDLQICRATRDDVHPSRASVRIDALPAEISENKVDVVETAAYAANTLVLFLNSPKSIHSVSRRSPTPLTRRHINFCCDVTSDLFEMRLPARLRLRKTVENTPVAWRLARWI
jgi:hypothetical protein